MQICGVHVMGASVAVPIWLLPFGKGCPGIRGKSGPMWLPTPSGFLTMRIADASGRSPACTLLRDGLAPLTEIADDGHFGLRDMLGCIFGRITLWYSVLTVFWGD